MQQNEILAVSGMDGFGLGDGHLVIPMQGAELFLGMAAHVTDNIGNVGDIFGLATSTLDAETSIRRYLRWFKIKVARFKRVMFIVRDPADKDNTWNPGEYDDSAGYILKHRLEYEEAQATAKWLAQHNNTWGTFVPGYLPMSLDRSRPSSLFYMENLWNQCCHRSCLQHVWKSRRRVRRSLTWLPPTIQA
jgi:hypothetical protein